MTLKPIDFEILRANLNDYNYILEIVLKNTIKTKPLSQALDSTLKNSKELWTSKF